jgi:hypothetical protein
VDTSVSCNQRLSSKESMYYGNGKIDRPPYPVGLRKIKRVGFNVFLGLKEIVDINSVKVVRLVPPRRDRKKTVFKRKKPPPGDIRERRSVYELEPGQATRLFNSYPRRWNRVNQWHEYINDSGRANKRDT